MTSAKYPTWNIYTCETPLTAEQWEEAFRKSREMAIAVQAIPTAYVMTTRSLQAIKDHESAKCQGMPSTDEYKGDLYKSIFGIPVEHYATLRECFDRMVAAREGERLQLAMSDDEMTVDLIGHPYIKKSGKQKAVAEYMERVKDIDTLGW